MCNIEYLIDNNLFFTEIKPHLCPIHKEQIINYRMKHKFDLKELINNTINRYFDDLVEFKRRYELDKNANLIYSEKRYMNYISLNKIEELKFKFMNSPLTYLEYVVSSVQKPYLDFLYNFLFAINQSLYIKNVQFNNNSIQYNYNNYKNKITSMKENALNFNDEKKLQDAKIHEGLITLYKDNKIEGSATISSITNSMIFKIIEFYEIEDMNKEDIEILKKNQFFHKQFEKVNFTEKEMYDGYAQAIYYNYAHFKIKQYKYYRSEYNKNRTSTIPYIRKDIIANEVKELFNFLMDKNVIESIRETSKKTELLKYYDEIPIFTTKNLTNLDDNFYEFMIENFFDKNEDLNFINSNLEQFKNIVSKLRTIFY
ncbi:hypothetical protein N5U17_10625 [Aliarcobacter butzleri]|uniref:hypothetical protein n=1 Tax=Aliarcobacter butzleri TaxID=28197 RepID=UPI0021B3731A|nr:hypothetical protein [Aliarcobacter butzleri]MCT7604688.1 hypothetical protein [Aliarcobacter butzleri]